MIIIIKYNQISQTSYRYWSAEEAEGRMRGGEVTSEGEGGGRDLFSFWRKLGKASDDLLSMFVYIPPIAQDTETRTWPQPRNWAQGLK